MKGDALIAASRRQVVLDCAGAQGGAAELAAGNLRNVLVERGAAYGGEMIARMWRGWVPTEKAAEYVEIVERTGMAGYRSTPGNEGAQLLSRDLGDGRTEIVTLSWWSDLDQIRAFAGDDVDHAKYYPEDDEYLLDREATVSHFEVAPPSSP